MRPASTDDTYDPVVPDLEDGELVVVAELVEVDVRSTLTVARLK